MECKDGTVFIFLGFTILVYIGHIDTQTSTNVENDCPWGTSTINVTENDLLKPGQRNDSFILCEQTFTRASCEILCEPKVSSPVFNCTGRSTVTAPMNLYADVVLGNTELQIECILVSEASIITISCKEKRSPPTGTNSCEDAISSNGEYPLQVDCLSPRCAYQSTTVMTTWTSSQEPSTTMSSTNSSPTGNEQNPLPPTSPSGSEGTNPGSNSTPTGAVVGGIVGVISMFVVIVIIIVVLWKCRKGGFPWLESKKSKEEPQVYSIPESPRSRPTPSPRPDVRKAGHVTVTEISTSNVYEDVDGQNTQNRLRLQSTHEDDYLELIGPDVPETAQTIKTGTSGKDSESPEDGHTYENVDDESETSSHPDYYNSEQINNAKKSTSVV